VSIENKKIALRNIVKDYIQKLSSKAIKDIDEVLNSGCIDLESYVFGGPNEMILPKVIVTAIMEEAARQYAPHETFPEFKEVRAEIDNIKLFI